MLVLFIGLDCRNQRGGSDGGMQILHITAFGNRSLHFFSDLNYLIRWMIASSDL